LADIRPFWKNCWQELKENLLFALSFYQNWKNSPNLELQENFLDDFYLIEILSWNIFSNSGVAKFLTTNYKHIIFTIL
jgi:hypothetical protein